jgi:hypothetical protein
VEPLSLSVLGAVALTEGVKFLYEQAFALIRAARDRRRAARDATAHDATTHDQTAQPDRLDVPIVANTVLDGAVTSTVDASVLDREHAELLRLAGTLAPYASGAADVEADDRELLASAHRLRTLLEAAYGQRLTLRGEQRERTGTVVNVSQVLGEVAGEAVALRADSVEGEAHVIVEQSASNVASGGSVTGLQIGRIGGGQAT